MAVVVVMTITVVTIVVIVVAGAIGRAINHVVQGFDLGGLHAVWPLHCLKLHLLARA